MSKKEAILTVNNLSVSFTNGIKQEAYCAVKDVSFELKSGEVLGIVGESGSGKSVTALSLLGLLSGNKVVYGKESSVKIGDTEIIGAPEKDLESIRGGKVGFIFQEPMSSLNPLHKVGKQVAETLCIHQKMPINKALRKAVKLLGLAGIKNPAAKSRAYPFELSGGQRQRVMIAMAIANHPQILIADEPTTALDVTIQEQIIKLLMELKKSFNMSIIFISHDLSLVRKIADRIIVMYQGKIVEQGRTEDIFNHPQERYTKELIKASDCSENCPKSTEEVIMRADKVSIEYPLKKNFWGKVIKKLHAVDNVSINIYRGQTLGIVGESGSGKTTLGLCLAKLIKFSGAVELYEDIENSKEFHRLVQIVFQDPYNSLNPRLNIAEIVGEGLAVHNPELSKDEINKRVASILREVGLSQDDLYKYPHEFSGGQRQRIAIARALIVKPKVVILDEPTSALDVTIQSQIIELLKSLQQRLNMTYIFISHDMRAIRAISDRIAVMKDGKIMEEDTANNIFNNAKEEYTKRLIKASMLK